MNVKSSVAINFFIFFSPLSSLDISAAYDPLEQYQIAPGPAMPGRYQSIHWIWLGLHELSPMGKFSFRTWQTPFRRSKEVNATLQYYTTIFSQVQWCWPGVFKFQCLVSANSFPTLPRPYRTGTVNDVVLWKIYFTLTLNKCCLRYSFTYEQFWLSASSKAGSRPNNELE
jgi:hypothetical protein